MKRVILFEGWYDIPHSYAIIMAFKLVHLYKKYHNEITFYKRSMPYYNPNWKHHKILPDSYTSIINNIKELPENTDIHIDLIYSVVFPYNISMPPNGTKKCVFYTSEFRTLTDNYFSGHNELSFKNLWYTGPSKWSICGLESVVASSRNRLISHGVDETVLYKSDNDRKKFRTKYDIADDTFVFLNIGSMTSNKNIANVIIAFLHIVINSIKSDQIMKYKLVLKGSDSLYNSSLMINQILSHIESPSINIPYLVEKYIIFIYDMLTYDDLRSVYNGCDAYVGPYLAEGFSLTHLESLFCSLRIIVPTTGATEDYIDDIIKNDPESAKLIYKVPSIVSKNSENNQYSNIIDLNDIISAMIAAASSTPVSQYDTSYLVSKYSWSIITDQLYEYFTDIHSSSSFVSS